MSGLGLFGAFLLAASPLAADLQFQNSYRGDELPEKAVPKWTVKGNTAEVTIESGALNVASSGPNKRQFYVMDQASGTWDMASGLATVEFRVKCASTNPDDEVFRVQVSDGSLIWRAVFFPNRCQGTKVDTENWDTYRLTVKDGRMQISSQALGIVASEIEGSPLVDTPSILFGTFKGSPSDASRSWNLEFIRWTNDEALMVEPAPK